MTRPTPERRRAAWILAAVLVSGLGSAAHPGALSAQRLQGRIVDTSTEAPLAGAALQLLAPDSTVVLYGVSDEGGGFTLIARDAGEYTLKIAYLGYQSALLGPLPLESGKTLDITVALGRARTPIDTAAAGGGRRYLAMQRSRTAPAAPGPDAPDAP